MLLNNAISQFYVDFIFLFTHYFLDKGTISWIIGLSGYGSQRNGLVSSCNLRDRLRRNRLSRIGSSSSHSRCGRARILLSILYTWDRSCQGILRFHSHFPWVWSWEDSQCIVLSGIWHIQFAFSCRFLGESGRIHIHRRHTCSRCRSCSFEFCSLRFQVCKVCSILCKHDQLHFCIPRWNSWHRCCCRDWSHEHSQCRFVSVCLRIWHSSWQSWCKFQLEGRSLYKIKGTRSTVDANSKSIFLEATQNVRFLAFAIDHVESDFALGARTISSSECTAFFSGLGIHFTETCFFVEDIAIVALFAAWLSLVGVASFDISRLDADAERVGDVALLTSQS